MTNERRDIQRETDKLIGEIATNVQVLTVSVDNISTNLEAKEERDEKKFDLLFEGFNHIQGMKENIKNQKWVIGLIIAALGALLLLIIS
jgi:hypothetical protein